MTLISRLRVAVQVVLVQRGRILERISVRIHITAKTSLSSYYYTAARGEAPRRQRQPGGVSVSRAVAFAMSMRTAPAERELLPVARCMPVTTRAIIILEVMRICLTGSRTRSRLAFENSLPRRESIHVLKFRVPTPILLYTSRLRRPALAHCIVKYARVFPHSRSFLDPFMHVIDANDVRTRVRARARRRDRQSEIRGSRGHRSPHGRL